MQGYDYGVIMNLNGFYSDGGKEEEEDLNLGEGIFSIGHHYICTSYLYYTYYNVIVFIL